MESARTARDELIRVRLEYERDRTGAERAIKMSRQIRGQVRALLGALTESPQDLEIAELGAELLCSAVRIGEVTFTLAERIDWFSKLLPLADQFRDTTLPGRFLANYGNALADAGKLDEAEAVLTRRQALAQHQQDLTAQALAQEHLGKLLLRQGRLAEAEVILNQAFRNAQQSNHFETVTRLLAEQANSRFRAGEIDAGVELLEQRLARCVDAGDLLLALSTLHTLATQLMFAERLVPAWEYAQKALVLAKQLRQRSSTAAILGTLGDIRMEEGNCAEARQLISAARRIARQTGDLVMQANTATSLGLIARKQCRFKQAVRWFQLAVDIDRATQRRGDEATDLGNWAATLIDLNETVSAIGLYEQRLRILESLGQERRARETRALLDQLRVRSSPPSSPT